LLTIVTFVIVLILILVYGPSLQQNLLKETALLETG